MTTEILATVLTVLLILCAVVARLFEASGALYITFLIPIPLAVLWLSGPVNRWIGLNTKEPHNTNRQ